MGGLHSWRSLTRTTMRQNPLSTHSESYTILVGNRKTLRQLTAGGGIPQANSAPFKFTVRLMGVQFTWPVGTDLLYKGVIVY